MPPIRNLHGVARRRLHRRGNDDPRNGREIGVAIRTAMTDSPVTLIHAAAVRDATGIDARPGAVAVAAGRVVAAGTPESVRAAIGGARIERELDRPDALVLPAFVNAHAHLDLHPIGPISYGAAGFVGWVGEVIRRRSHDAATIRAAVHAAARASRASGVAWVGDIAGSPHAVCARFDAPPDAHVGGVAWLECFGVGRSAADGARRAAERLRELREVAATVPAHPDPVRVDLQPHAPYSAGRAVFEIAAALGAPATHLAETSEEAEFVRSASGPFAALLRRIGEWDETILPHRTTPIAALAPVLAKAPWVVAHANYVDDADLERLARLGTVTVAYCPVASAYFEHEHHRYGEMLDRGIRVALGTDSILCQPADEPQPYGILPQARFLHRRNRTAPDRLLAMATIHGSAALGLPTGTATLAPGAPARLAAVTIDPDDPRDAWEQALRGHALMLDIEVADARYRRRPAR